jgi:hypothetical protein
MGCDIHFHTEVKVDGTWHHHSNPKIERDYWLFALLANVRNYDDEVQPISDPRGLPSDVSVVTQIYREKDGVDGHSDTWIAANEMAEVCKKWNEKRVSGFGQGLHHQLGYLLGNYWGNFNELRSDEVDGKRYQRIEDVRWVFWFDN